MWISHCNFHSLSCFIDYCQSIILLDIFYIWLFPKSLKFSFIVKVGYIDYSPSPVLSTSCLLPPNFHGFLNSVFHFLLCFHTCTVLTTVHFSQAPFILFTFPYSPIPTSPVRIKQGFWVPLFFSGAGASVTYKQLRNKIRYKVSDYRRTHT